MINEYKFIDCMDNGLEFSAEKLKDWCRENEIVPDYIQPGKTNTKFSDRTRLRS